MEPSRFPGGALTPTPADKAFVRAQAEALFKPKILGRAADLANAIEPQAPRDVVVRPAHYTAAGGIEPIDFIMSNSIPYAEGNVIKYVFRHRMKKGAEDLKKAINYLRFILEKEYGVTIALSAT